MRKSTFAFALALCAVPMLRAQTPMFIINGVRVADCEGSSGTVSRLLANIDPAVIQNVEVVKGPAAVQQYGAGAANGVITVTTTKGAIVYSPTGCAIAAPAGSDAFTKFLYAPEFVMAHQQAISLTDAQRNAIQEAAKEIQSGVIDAQFKLASATEQLTHLLSAPTVDEAAALREIDETLALERTIKRAQVSLLVRVKNQLTAQQQKALDKLKAP